MKVKDLDVANTTLNCVEFTRVSGNHVNFIEAYTDIVKKALNFANDTVVPDEIVVDAPIVVVEPKAETEVVEQIENLIVS